MTDGEENVTARQKAKGVRKVFIIDTSTLIHAPESILSFQDNIVVIPFPVLEELDNKKEDKKIVGNGAASQARAAIRILDGFRKKGFLHCGVETPGGGIILVENSGNFPQELQLKEGKVDNFVVAVALKWKSGSEWLRRSGVGKEDVLKKTLERFELGDIIVVAKDFSLRVKASACGVLSEDYLTDRLVESESQLYSGIARVQVGEDAFKKINSFLYNNDESFISSDDVEVIMGRTLNLFPNQACVFECNDRSSLSIYKKQVLTSFKKEGKKEEMLQSGFVGVLKPKDYPPRCGIEPRNAEQALAMKLLMDQAVKIITLSGIAGSGKTLMALLAGLRQMEDERYERIIVYRSNVEIGEKLGFLPGDLDEKFAPWTKPILDLLEILDNGSEKAASQKEKRKCFDVKNLFDTDCIKIEPINHIQGRSLHRTFIIVDETQNFRPSDLKKMVTRVGAGSKIVLTGDIDQVESNYLDKVTNGLSHVIERLKGQEVFGHITLPKSERSDIAQLAATLL